MTKVKDREVVSNVPEEFNKWWNSDVLTGHNPFKKDTPAFWAWEGWVAGTILEREALGIR